MLFHDFNFQSIFPTLLIKNYIESTENLKIILFLTCKIIIHAKATFMHSIYYQYAPNSFTDTWSTLAQLQPEMNLRNSHNFYLSFPRIELFKRLPLYSLPSTWNDLGDLRFQPNKFTFRTSLYDFLQPLPPPLPSLV